MSAATYFLAAVGLMALLFVAAMVLDARYDTAREQERDDG